jgi:hypothetical protein
VETKTKFESLVNLFKETDHIFIQQCISIFQKKKKIDYNSNENERQYAWFTRNEMSEQLTIR